MGSSDRKSQDPFASLGSVIKEILHKSDLVPQDFKQELALFEKWDSVVGAEISRQTKPKQFKNGILYVETHSAIWARELQWKSGQIMKKINALLEKDLVKEIQFRTRKV